MAQLHKNARNVCALFGITKFAVSATILLEIQSMVQQACCRLSQADASNKPAIRISIVYSSFW